MGDPWMRRIIVVGLFLLVVVFFDAALNRYELVAPGGEGGGGMFRLDTMTGEVVWVYGGAMMRVKPPK